MAFRDVFRNFVGWALGTWRDQVIFDEIIIMSVVQVTNTLKCTWIVLTHCNYSLWVDISLKRDIVSLFRANQSVCSEAANTNCIVFALIRLGHEPTIYLILGEYASNDTSLTVLKYIFMAFGRDQLSPTKILPWRILRSKSLLICLNDVCLAEK